MIQRNWFFICLAFFHLCVLCASVVQSRAAEPCRSGLPPGQRPGPYAALIATGPERGKSICYVCETADRPAVIVFARSLSDSLGTLVHKLDQAVTQHKAANMRAWVTFLSDDQPGLDPKVVDWSRKHAISTVPLGIFEDAGGPPSYRLAAEADVTVLLFVQQKVIANFAFRSGELNEDRTADVMKAVPRIVTAKK